MEVIIETLEGQLVDLENERWKDSQSNRAQSEKPSVVETDGYSQYSREAKIVPQNKFKVRAIDRSKMTKKELDHFNLKEIFSFYAK